MLDPKEKSDQPQLPGQAGSEIEPTSARYIVRGDIHAHEVQFGDRYTYTYQDQRSVQIETPAAYIEALHDLQTQVAAMRLLPALDQTDQQTVTVIESRVQEAAAEAQQPKPAVERLTSALGKAKKLLDTLAGTAASAASLGIGLDALIEAGKKLF